MDIAAATERSPELGLPGPGGSDCGRPPPLPNTDPSFPIPGSPHLNFGGTRAAKLSADLRRTPAPAAHGAPGEEREGGGEGEGAGLPGGRGRARHLPAPRVVRAATVAARPRGRGGAGSCAPLWAPPRCAPLQSPAAPGARAGVAPPRLARGGEGGGACSTCPSSPSPRPKLKNNKKQLITPERSASRRGGRRTRRAAPGLSRRRAWLGAGWDAGLGCRGVRLSSSGSARTPALAAASTSQLRLRRLCRRAARPPGQELRTLPGGCRQNPDRTSGSLTPPLHLGFPPSSAASLPDQLWPLGRRRL